MRIAVVIPCFKVRTHIRRVLEEIPNEVEKIYVVDDECPEQSGNYVISLGLGPRVEVLFNSENQGVGGAVIQGYRRAMEEQADIVVKVDGDGQMDGARIMHLCQPLLEGKAGYAKGNRFNNLDELANMPRLRLFGNGVLSVLTKVSSGYWSIADPTNGFTAISSNALRGIDLDKISKRYFFESDMLFRLYLSRVAVSDVYMPARYGDEESQLKIHKVVPEFLLKNLRNTTKRILYCYYLREWSIATFELPLGLAFVSFGSVFALTRYDAALDAGGRITAGEASLVTILVILGFQFLLSFLSFDIQAEPRAR